MAASNIGFRLDGLYKEVGNRILKDNLGLVHLINTSDFNAGLMQGYAGVGYALIMYRDRKSGKMLV